MPTTSSNQYKIKPSLPFIPWEEKKSKLSSIYTYLLKLEVNRTQGSKLAPIRRTRRSSTILQLNFSECRVFTLCFTANLGNFGLWFCLVTVWLCTCVAKKAHLCNMYIQLANDAFARKRSKHNSSDRERTGDDSKITRNFRSRGFISIVSQNLEESMVEWSKAWIKQLQ